MIDRRQYAALSDIAGEPGKFDVLDPPMNVGSRTLRGLVASGYIDIMVTLSAKAVNAIEEYAAQAERAAQARRDTLARIEQSRRLQIRFKPVPAAPPRRSMADAALLVPATPKPPRATAAPLPPSKINTGPGIAAKRMGAKA